MMALSLEIPIGFKMAKQVMAQLEVLIFLQNQIALQVGSSSSRGLGNRSKDTLMAAWNVTICSSASSLLKLTSKSRAEQVLGMLSSPEVSLSTITRGRTDQKYVPNEDRLHMGPSPKRGYYAAFTDMADEDTVVEEEIAGGVVLKKRRLTMEQVRFLESSFESENKLEPERKAQIAQRLGLQPRQVAVWFQNRRARSKSKQLERDFLALKADYEAVLVENQKLQAEVDRLLAQLREENVPMQNLRTLDTKTATSTKDALTSGSNVSSASNRGSPAPMSSKAVEDEADAEASTASGEAPLEAGGGDEEEEQLSACTLKQEIASSILPLHLQLPSVIAKVADKSTAAASEAFFPDDIHMLANSVHHAYAHQLLDLYADSLGLYENGLFITSLEEPWGGS